MKKIIPYVLATCLLACTSCLKDDYTDFSKVGTVIELLDASTDPIAAPVSFTNTTSDLNVRVNVAAPSPLDRDVTVTLAVDKAAFTPFSADYALLPDSTYTIPNAKVVISAGQQVAPLVIKIKPSKVDLTQNYLLPVKITDASGYTISGNFGTIYLNVSIKNIYDGSYHASGTLIRQGNPVNTIDEDKALSTIDGVTSRTLASYFGNATLQLDVVVNADNTVTIKPVAGAGASISGTPGKTSTYDPAKKSFHLYYQYVNGSGLSRVFDETLTPN